MLSTPHLTTTRPTMAQEQAIQSVLKRIPPLWDLTDYVAVNPFLGFSHRPIGEAARDIHDALSASVLPPMRYFKDRIRSHPSIASHIGPAARRLGADAAAIQQSLTTPYAASRPASHITTFAERHDAADGTQWELFLRTSIARYCAVYADGGGTNWPIDRSFNLWNVWHEASIVDRAPDWSGLIGYRQFVATLPNSPQEAVAQVLSDIELPADDLDPYLYRLIGGLFGWASYFRRASWSDQTIKSDPLFDLLAIRLCADAFFAAHDGKGSPIVAQTGDDVEDETIRLALQEAVEDHYVTSIALKFRPAAPTATRPAVQAVFCIDVRSEVFRRHLEALDPSIVTMGFAGFFGVSLNVESGSARCPVLLKPSINVSLMGLNDSKWKSAFKRIQLMPPTAFSFVEVLGAGYGVKLLKDTCAGASTMDPETTASFATPDQSHASRVATAGFILKNMSIARPLARLVLLCGHQGRSANNPHAAGLDCGACGGHGGGINARVAADILNDPRVREDLALQGTVVPDDAHFVPGVHDTSDDTVYLMDTHLVPSTHREDLARLKMWLEQAGKATRAERAATLGIINQPEPAGLLQRLKRRARNWSEVRPEWALARNACFVASRRSRTRGVDLGGRSFLHDYDHAADTDASVLKLILSAPMVVASWINLQYFGSTVDNDLFGAGNKTLHNRIGRLGVVLGNGGDLRGGLAMQSVHSPGGAWYHEPMRLQVIVEAPVEKIDRVVNAVASVRDLVSNGWVRLFALDPDSNEIQHRAGSGVWETVTQHGC